MILLRIIADHAATKSAAGSPNGNNGDNNDDNTNRPNANNNNNKVGSLPGAMNSWFLYEFTVYSMGSISANIMNYLGKFD